MAQGEVAKPRRRGESLSASTLTPERFSSLMKLLSDGTIHANIARRLIELMLEGDEDPQQIIDEQGAARIRAGRRGLEDCRRAGHRTAARRGR